MGYTTDPKVREYIDASGSVGFGTNVIGTTTVGNKIAMADSIIDMRLSRRYSTPFATTPPAIETVSTVFSAWFSLRSVYTGEMPSSLAFVKDDYDRAEEWITMLQDGKIDLPSGTSSASSVIADRSSSTTVWSSTQDYTPIFDVDDELQQKVDDDRLSDIGDSRE